MRPLPIVPSSLAEAQIALEAARATAAQWNFVLGLATALLREDDVEQRGVLLLERLRERTGDARMAVLTLQGGRLRPVAGRGLPPGAENVAIDADGPLGEALRAGNPIHVVDSRAAPLRVLGTSCVVPCLGRGGKVVMAVAVHDRAVPMELLRDVCAHVATAFEGTHTARALYTPGLDPRDPALHARLAAAWTTDGLATTLADEARAVAAARRATVLVPSASGDALVVRAATGLGEDAVEERIRRGEEIGVRFHRGRGLPCLAWETGQAQFHVDGERQTGVLAVPLLHDGTVRGVLTLHWAGRDVPRSPDRALDVLGPLQATGGACLARTVRTDQVTVDADTGLPNEAAWSALVGEMQRRSVREGRALTVIGVTLAEGPPPAGRLRPATLLRGVLRGVGEAGVLANGRMAFALPGLDAKASLAVVRRVVSELEAWVPHTHVLEVRPGVRVGWAVEQLRNAGAAVG